MNGRILIVAGTSEGHSLFETLLSRGYDVYASVATTYGGEILSEPARVFVGRLDAEGLALLLAKEHYALVIDATHPYAQCVTENLVRACEQTGTQYLRTRRTSEQVSGARCFETASQAAEYLCGTEGNILSTIGSKELSALTAIKDYQTRVYARFLPLSEALEHARELGFPAQNLLCMQGSFSAELNEALLREHDCRFLLTKESGSAGGFAEKQLAAARAGAELVVINRPQENGGLSIAQTLEYVADNFAPSEAHASYVSPLCACRIQKKDEKAVIVLGVGVGNTALLSEKSVRLIRQAKTVLGAPRLAKELLDIRADIIGMGVGDIIAALREKRFEAPLLLASGDVGFFSIAETLRRELPQTHFEFVSAISSLAYFSARIGKAYHDMKLVSLHGRSQSPIPYVCYNRKVFFLTGGSMHAHNIINILNDSGLSFVRVYVGENLSAADERIDFGTAAELSGHVYGELCVVYVENDSFVDASVVLRDEDFERDRVPITKQEIRDIVLSRLSVSPSATVFDIGAGSGSVSIALARRACEGSVYALEKNDSACSLIEKNIKKLGAYNVFLVRGAAQDNIHSLPAPDAVFVGGSSGELDKIIGGVLLLNPKARIVLTAITLETLSAVLSVLRKYHIEAEIACINVSRAEKLGDYHMMKAQNPIYIISGQADER